MKAEPRVLGACWAPSPDPRWTLRRIKDVATIINGYPFDASFFDAAGIYPLVRIRDLDSETTETRYSGEWVEAAAIDAGDVLIGMDGDFNVGVWKGGRALLNQRMCCVRAEPLMRRFLSYVLPTPLKVANDLTYSTTVKHLSSLDVERITFAVPPENLLEPTLNFLDEQTARIDALIAEKERLVSTIEEYWRSYLYSSMQSAACLGLESPSGEWALEPVKRVCASIQTGRTPSGARDDCFTEDGVPWVTPGDMDDIFVKSSGKSVSYVALHDGEAVLYPPGSTLLVGIGATLGTVSNARVAVSANQQINILVPDPRKIDALFLTFAIKANQDQVRLSAGAATLPILNQERTGRLKIAIPRMEQQIATRSQLLRLKENANRLLSHVGRHISILREYRSSLISAAVTGQLDIDNFGIGG